MKKTGFIGAGNMGSAIINAMIKSGNFVSTDITVTDTVINPNIEKLGVKIAKLEDNVIANDVVIFAVKPAQLPDVLNAVKNTAGYENKLYVSIAAGVKTESILSVLGNVALIRVMPNICLTAGEGMSVICTAGKASDKDVAFVNEIFASGGKVTVVSESAIDACTAINGSGPAYVFMFIEAMADAAVKQGIDRKTAYLLASQTVLGSAALQLDTGLHPGVLKDMVCSPGGTTIEAVEVLEQTGLRASVMAAVDACAEKARNLAKK